MNKETLQKLREAKGIICSYCKSDMCEWCRVENIVAYAESEDGEHCVRSSTCGDYGPSNPWDAPGMSISDFIR